MLTCSECSIYVYGILVICIFVFYLWTSALLPMVFGTFYIYFPPHPSSFSFPVLALALAGNPLNPPPGPAWLSASRAIAGGRSRQTRDDLQPKIMPK